VKRTIQISYDLSRPGDEYAELLAYLQRHRATKPLACTWFIKTPRTAVQVRDEILRLAYDEDEIVVLDVTGVEWATTFEDVTTDWMKAEMPRASSRAR
jgi:hypothetical protein